MPSGFFSGKMLTEANFPILAKTLIQKIYSFFIPKGCLNTKWIRNDCAVFIKYNFNLILCCNNSYADFNNIIKTLHQIL